jgi:hypothetical protein
VATSKIHVLSPSCYPGAPFSHPFLDRPWEFDTSDRKDGLVQLGAWRGLGSWEGKGGGPCSNSRALPCEELKNYMSQEPHASGPSSSSLRQTDQPGPHGSNTPSRQQSSEATDPRASHGSTGEAESTQAGSAPMFPPPAREQQQQQQPTMSGTLGPSRGLEMQSILNPSQPDSPASSSRGRRASTGGFPPSTDSPTPATLPPPRYHPRF